MTNRPVLLAAIDRRLWRDLGFAEPEPHILRFLPMLVVAWADGKLGDGERERILERAQALPEHLRPWILDRVKNPPGPYFRYQVAHLLTFLLSVWPSSDDPEADWATCGEQWADELIQDAGWIRRLFGAMTHERQTLDELRRLMEDHQILAGDRIWALARGAHADYEPRHAALLREEPDQALHGLAITLDGPGERVAVGCVTTLVRDEDLSPERVAAVLARTTHLRENERWILLGEEVIARGRTPTPRLRQEVVAGLTQQLGCPIEDASFAELAYLEDALAADARWMSWMPGMVEELRVDREEVVRCQAPGTFLAERHAVKASVAQTLVPGPAGLGFRILEIQSASGSLRLASPVVLTDPCPAEGVAWIARFLPAMCDPCTQLVLDSDGPRWIAEVHPAYPTLPSSGTEPLVPGRSLLVPPWVWFRAASALGVRFFSGRRRSS